MIVANVEWLVVDLGGVAAQYRPERRLNALERETGIPPDVIHERLFASGLDHDAELGRHTIASITAALVERLEHRISIPTLIDAWALAFEPNVELLDGIAPLHRKRALFTNNGPMLDLCLSGPLTQLASTFDAIICSWHLTATKPNPEAFARAATQLHSSPPQLLLVDDSQANIDAAQQAGWHAVAHVSTKLTLTKLVETRSTETEDPADRRSPSRDSP